MYEGWTKPELWLHQLWQFWLGISRPLQTHDSGLLGESLSVGLLTSRFYVCFICWNSLRKLNSISILFRLFVPLGRPTWSSLWWSYSWALSTSSTWFWLWLLWHTMSRTKPPWLKLVRKKRSFKDYLSNSGTKSKRSGDYHMISLIRLNCLKTSATSDSQCNHIDNVMHIKTPKHLQLIDLHWYVTLICWYIVVYLNYRQAVKHLWPARRHKVEGQTGRVPCTVLAVMML